MTKPIIGLTLNFRDANRTRRCVESLLSNGAEHVVVWDNSDDACGLAPDTRPLDLYIQEFFAFSDVASDNDQ